MRDGGPGLELGQISAGKAGGAGKGQPVVGQGAPCLDEALVGKPSARYRLEPAGPVAGPANTQNARVSLYLLWFPARERPEG